MKRRGTLDNQYIPPLSQSTLRRLLSRLPLKSINNLAFLWCKLTITQPNLKNSTEYRLNNLTRSQLTLNAVKFFGLHSKSIKVHESGDIDDDTIGLLNKKQLLDKLLIEYWHKGLNLLQLSQIDCQLLIDQPDSYQWTSSKIVNNFKEITELLIPQENFAKLLKNLNQDLNPIYLNHIYVCHHPNYPIVIIRVQLFDIISKHNNESDHKLQSRKPFFIIIPSSSNKIIHNLFNINDLSAKIILQSLEKSLSSSDEQIHLVQDKTSVEFKNFETIFLINGISRFNNCQGNWAVYADDNVDISPFDLPENHFMMKECNKENEIEEYEDDGLEIIDNDDKKKKIELLTIKKVANLRFKGTKTGKIKSKKFHQDYLISKNQSKIDSQKNSQKNEFSSIIPIEQIEFTIHKNLNDKNNDKIQLVPKFKLKLIGNDVFGGLHELSTKPISKDSIKPIINPYEVPSWLTGEEGMKSGVIINNKFQSTDEQFSHDDYFDQFNTDGGII